MIDFGPYTKLYTEYLEEKAKLEEKTIKVKPYKKGDSATERYMTLRQGIQDQMKELSLALNKMDIAQAKGQEDWGYAGNAGHVFELLNQILEFLK